MAVPPFVFPGMPCGHAGPPMRISSPLLFAVAASLSAHALLLILPGWGGWGGGTLPAPARHLHVHMAVAAGIHPAVATPTPLSPVSPVAPTSESAERVRGDLAAPGRGEPPVGVATASPPAVFASPPEDLAIPRLAGPMGTAYLPPEAVDRRATVIEAQPLPLPPAGSSPGRLQAKLFLNAQGEVEDMEVESNALAPEYDEALRQYFPSMHFRPAEKDGRPVASWIRMEFVYEDAPPAPP